MFERRFQRQNSIGLVIYRQHFVLSHGQARKHNITVVLDGPCTNSLIARHFRSRGLGLDSDIRWNLGYRKDYATTNADLFIHALI